MRLTCAIIDDEPLAVSLLESYVLKTPFLDLQGTYNSALDALSDLRDRSVDLLFLDIQMPELSGLEFSRILNADTRVIFTTAFDQYAVDSYRVNALDYLLKPISYPDFLASKSSPCKTVSLPRRIRRCDGMSCSVSRCLRKRRKDLRQSLRRAGWRAFSSRVSISCCK